MNIVRYIGDVHGKFSRYARIIKNSPPSVQVGDMGIGFIRYGGFNHGSFMENPPFDKMVKANARFERGNHDNPSVCKKHKQFIPDGTVEDDVMYIGGAVSIDRDYRVENYSWWRDEEPSISELMTITDVYNIIKPRVMITHEIPELVAGILCAYVGRQKFHDASRCRQAFQSMLEIHQPKLWVGGHWHLSFDKIIDGTRFIILNELEWIDINMETLEIVNRGQG